MKPEYDLAVVGLGPAGMAVSVMGAEMGLRVCAIEERRIGGECMNVGCIPSKALLRIAAARHAFSRLEAMALDPAPPPAVGDVFGLIRGTLRRISETKTSAMFRKTRLLLGEGPAAFADPHTLEVGRHRVTARRIFLCVGTRPALPPIPGLADIEVLTNENLFELERLPESLAILGGGAIGCEMAQAFSRLGCPSTLVHMDAHLLPAADAEAGGILEEAFGRESIRALNGRAIRRVERTPRGVAVVTESGDRVEAARLLVAAGRRPNLEPLRLERAGLRAGPRGLVVNRHLRAGRRHLFAAGDCNGHALFSHAAMHQGMIALVNSLLPAPFRMDFRRFAVPWTVFTDPQVSQVGRTGEALEAAGIRHETIRVDYADYGAAIAEQVDRGHVKAWVSPAGRIYGAQVIGEGSGEMINEWALAVQRRVRMHELMLLQHSFPTMGFLSKRSAETWMMNRMKAPWVQRLARRLF